MKRCLELTALSVAAVVLQGCASIVHVVGSMTGSSDQVDSRCDQLHITHISLHWNGAPLSVYGLDAERVVVAEWITRMGR